MTILIILLSIIPLAVLGLILWLIGLFIKPIMKFAFIGFSFLFVVFVLISLTYY